MAGSMGEREIINFVVTCKHVINDNKDFIFSL